METNSDPRNTGATLPDVATLQLDWREPRATVIDSTWGLSEIEAEWRNLWNADLAATPFQNPDWLIPWTRQENAVAAILW